MERELEVYQKGGKAFDELWNRDQVAMHLISDTNDNQVRLMDLLETWKKKNIQTGYEITAQIQELDSIALFRTQTTVATKFYFQVDGLDEYYGDSWDVIETMRDLSAAPNVKLCLSSRPWNCFQRSFGQENPYVLRIDDFTRPDIELFARETLLRSYRGCVDFGSKIFDELIKDIGERAQGVFLWVRLVVRSLRDGIVNEDSVSLLQKRLRVIPSDLEDFFEQILGSVEEIYRSRMAGTFLAAMRTPLQLDLIHYYFLEQDDENFNLDMPSKRWDAPDIQRCAVQTERRLNGRFKGLLEASSMVGISADTKVDFLHRTLSDFLATKRMREKLESWVLGELNVCTAISRALIAASKFIEENSCLSTLKLAVELAGQGAFETYDTGHYFEVIDQAEVENERTRPFHSSCGLNCDIVQFAASIGHAEYLKYRVHKDGADLNLDRILKHVIARPVGLHEEYDLMPSTIERYGSSSQLVDWFDPVLSTSVMDCVLPSLVKQLLELGANPNSLIDGVSSWTTFADELPKFINSKQELQCWAVLKIFVENGADLNTATEQWVGLLDRAKPKSEGSLRYTLECFKRLFSLGLDPNAVTQHSTLTTEFFRLVTRDAFDMHRGSQAIQHELMHEFLRHGADVSMVYEDTMLSDNGSPRGWYQNVCQQLELYHQTNTTLLLVRVSLYRMFLEHGLDPNAVTPSGNTLWEGLLEAMHSVDENSVHESALDESLSDLFLFSLQYGADPFVPTILRLLKRFQNFMSAHIFGPIETTLKTEISQRKSRNRHRSRTQPRSDGPSRRGLPRSFKSPPPVARQKIRQVKKRDHGDTSQSTHDPKSKRGRFS
ncbi:hypothetical protein J4E81_009797 [Alternaria sp. BMP 2799]|nr:hypothetical protein J4E81_009797 [Alternaria sp. BMP 2799]